MMHKISVIGLWIVALWLPVGALAESELTTLQRVDKAMGPPSRQAFIEVVEQSPGLPERKTVLFMVRKGPDRLLAQVIAPNKLKGWSLLRLGQKIVLRRSSDVTPQEIKPMASLIHGLFTNGDLLPRGYAREYRVVSSREEGRERVLELAPRDKDDLTSAYRKVVLRINAKNFLPLEAEHYLAEGFLVKRVKMKKAARFPEGFLAPKLMEAVSAANPRYKARYAIGQMRSRELPDSIFSSDFLPHVGKLLLEDGAFVKKWDAEKRTAQAVEKAESKEN
ncbi:MAG: outer membrane lipoprotein-sorting protein [Magnetococcales bacterium]|nr:outer membrane lipoprotein-sorting protein [Magnetococcales bacterium]